MIYSNHQVKENTSKTRKELTMPMLSKTVVDSDLRARIFDEIFELSTEAGKIDAFTTDNDVEYRKVNDRQWGVILTDKNGHERYCRVGVIVAEEREDMTARELMKKEIDEYRAKQASKAEKAKAKEEKIARDKKAREEKTKKEEEGE